VNILFDNVNFSSNSGPNSFAKKLAYQFKDADYNVSINGENSPIDVQLSFISNKERRAPIALRLDGIYFNLEQNWTLLNEPIKRSYGIANAIIFQSEFNKLLIEKYFGPHENSHVIHNGTNLEWIKNIKPIEAPVLDNFAGTWCCASSWRPHKRLEENVRFFLDFAPSNYCLVIAGDNLNHQIDNPRIFYAGNLDWTSLIALYKRSEVFLHLAWLDHCPNVVVDARAAGCKIICSSTGGTKEVAGKGATIIQEDEWNLDPVKLYHPPTMNFSNTLENELDIDISILRSSEMYLDVLSEII